MKICKPKKVFNCIVNYKNPCNYCLKKPVCICPCDDLFIYSSKRVKMAIFIILGIDVLTFLIIYIIIKIIIYSGSNVEVNMSMIIRIGIMINIFYMHVLLVIRNYFLKLDRSIKHKMFMYRINLDMKMIKLLRRKKKL